MPCVKEDLLRELSHIVLECSTPDWDGYDADPVEQKTVEFATAFIYAIPPELPLPEICPEPDGSLGFDWWVCRSNQLSISVDKLGHLAFAWLKDRESGHGGMVFNGVSISPILINMIKLFKGEKHD